MQILENKENFPVENTQIKTPLSLAISSTQLSSFLYKPSKIICSDVSKLEIQDIYPDIDWPNPPLPKITAIEQQNKQAKFPEFIEKLSQYSAITELSFINCQLLTWDESAKDELRMDLDESPKKLTKWLQHFAKAKTWTKIHIHNDDFSLCSEEAAYALWSTLLQPQVTELYLFNVKLSSVAIKALAKVLAERKENLCLKNLVLSNAAIGEAEPQAVSEMLLALGALPQLEALNLANNKMCQQLEALPNLFSQLTPGKKLKILNFENNDFERKLDELPKCFKFIPVHTSLKQIHVKHPEVKKQVAQGLGEIPHFISSDQQKKKTLGKNSSLLLPNKIVKNNSSNVLIEDTTVASNESNLEHKTPLTTKGSSANLFFDDLFLSNDVLNNSKIVHSPPKQHQIDTESNLKKRAIFSNGNSILIS